MAGNFNTIGLGVGNEAQLQDLVVRLADAAGERLATDAGEYAIWRSRTGAELWFHLGPAGDCDGAEREIIGVTPFFEGRCEVLLQVDRSLKRPDDNSHEGAFHGWVRNGPNDDLGDYPLIFDAVDFAAHCDRPLPARWRVRLTGFAHEINVLPDDDDFAGRQSFYSAGTMAREQPTTDALLSGQIAGFAALTNEATGEPFYWLLVDSWGASYDIVVEPENACGDIKLGVTVSVDCAFFGRVLD